MIKRTPQLPNSDLFISFRYPFWYPRFVGRFSTLALKLVRPAAFVDKVPVSNIGARVQKAEALAVVGPSGGQIIFPAALNRLDEPTGGNLEPTRLRP